MPTYQYRCTDCGSDLEVVQKFSDAALTECPACGGSLRKVFNAVGVVFKGSGFYRTDSRAGSGDAESGKKTDSTAESGGDKLDGGDKADGGGTKTADGGSGERPSPKKEPVTASSGSSSPATSSGTTSSGTTNSAKTGSA